MDYRPERSRWPSIIAVIALIVLIATLALAGWLALQANSLSSFLPSQQPAELRVGLSTHFTTLDPILSSTLADFTLQAMLFEGVVAHGTTLAPEPRLATTLPESSADGRMWTITCRRDVRFHNGRSFTCDDVLTHLENLRTQTDALAANPVDASTLIVLLERITDMQLTDDYSLEVHLSTPFAFFNEALAHPAAAIAHDKAGSGPFRLESWDSEGAALTAYDNYWAGPPELPGVTLALVPDGATRLAALNNVFDAIDDLPADARLDEDTQKLVSGPGTQVIFVAINRNVPPLDNLQIRRALLSAIDPQLIAAQAFARHAQPAPSFTSPAMPGYDGQAAIQPDIILARELQANAGLPDGFETVVHYDRSLPDAEKLAEALRFQLVGLYIDSETAILAQPLDVSLSADAALPLLLSARAAPDEYAALSWLTDVPPPDGRNSIGYNNAAFRAWVEQASTALTREARDAALQNARRELSADTPLLILVAPDVLIATISSVSRLDVSPLGWMLITHETFLLAR